MFARPEPPQPIGRSFGAAKRAGLTVKHGISTILAAFLCASALATSGCGSSGGRDSPPVPNANIGFASFLVDIGERFQLDASASTDPENDGLEYFWTKIHPTSTSTFDDHCEDFPTVVCSSNSNDECLNDDSLGDAVFCATNADCTNGDDDRCLTNSGTMSPDCSTGICLLGFARQTEIASFVADKPGPYTVRLLAETSKGATNVEQRVLSTYPQLLVVGSLFGFGGARGALIQRYPDADSFASGAVAGVSSPTSGDMLLAIPNPGLVRAFSADDGSIVGTFGETGSVGINPIDLVFGQDGNLYCVDADGTVTIFGGANGLFIGVLGDVTAGTQEVASIAIRPANGNLLVADGRAGEPIREYGIASGNFRSNFGDTGTAVGQAVDLAFADDGMVYIADQDGQVVVCAQNGTACATLGGSSAALATGGPSAIAVNPAGEQTTAQIVIADAVAEQVIGCLADGSLCETFGDTVGLGSSYSDVFFAPPVLPTTTTTTTTTTTVSTTTTTLGT